jgi:tetratricopeptide (TPR) repeat protein
MKHFILPLLFLCSLLHAEEVKENDTPNLQENQKEFLNLPEDKRQEFIKNFGDANRFFQQKRIFESFEALEKANKIFDESPEIFNLFGSCYVEIRNFEKASEFFKKASELSPDNASIKFNIAEVYFVSKEWKKSHDLFQEVLKQTPESNIALSRLIEFKILLCKSKLGQEEEVVIMSEKYDFLDDSPYYYFAKAAVAFQKKNDQEAEQWLARAYRIFRDPAIIAPWQDTLVEFGYIRSFFNDPTLETE